MTGLCIIFLFSVPPATVQIENIASLVLVVGSGVDVVCHSGGSRPPAHLTWWIDTVRLGQYQWWLVAALKVQTDSSASENFLNESFVCKNEFEFSFRNAQKSFKT